MSVSYWMIEGIGIDVEKIEPFIDRKKLCHMLHEQLPSDELLQDIIDRKAYDELDYYDFLYGEPFQSLADILTHCDDSNSITYGGDGDGGEYFYYPPSMPWNRAGNEPKTIGEVHSRIIEAVQKITVLTSQEIENMIDDELYVYGCG